MYILSIIFISNKSPGSNPSRLQRIFYDWIFPGKCFPCYKTRVDENGKNLPPPSCSDVMKYNKQDKRSL